MKRLTPAHLALMLLVVGIILAAVLAERLSDAASTANQRARVLSDLGKLSDRLNANLSGNMQLVQGFRSILVLKPDLNQHEFEAAASLLFREHSQLRNIGAAPDMVIRLMHPMTGNQEALGFDYRTDPVQWEAAERARNTRRIVLAGPVRLVQGGTGIISRIPVYLPDSAGRDRFWGLISVVIDAERLYRDSGLLDRGLGLDIAIRGRDAKGPQGEVFFGRPDIFNERPVLADITLPVGAWQIAAVPRGGWTASVDNVWLVRLGFLLFALLLLWPVLVLRRAMHTVDDARRQVESEKARLTATLENAPNVAVQWYDRDGRILYWNSASERLFGWPSAEVLGKTLGELHYAEADAFVATLADIGSGNSVVGPYETTIRRSDGSDRVCTSTVFAIPGDAAPIYVCMDVDITDRKQAELALRASEQRFHQLFDNVHEAVAVHALDGSFLLSNRRMQEMFGVSAEEFGRYSIAKDYSAAGMPVDQLPSIWADVLAGNQSQFEWRVRRPHDGHEFDVDVLLSRIRYGDMDAILVTQRDITESKRMVVALRESEARFRALFDFAPVAYQSLDTKGRLLELNQQLISLLGYDREELLGRSFGDLWQEPGLFPSAFEAFVAKCSTTAELRLRRKNGEIVTVLLEGRIQCDDAGTFVRTHCVLYDISARKRAEDALNRYRFIVNSVHDMMTVVNREHRYEVVNDAWCQALQRPRESAIGRHLAEVWGDEVYRQYIAPSLGRCFKEERAVTLRTSIHLPQGYRECDISYLPYRDTAESGTHVVILTRDVTEQLETERAMIRARQEAENANRAKSVFLAQMSHELRTPLNAVIGFAQMLDLGVPVPLEPVQQEAVGHILGSGRHLLRLINEVLDLARIESGKLALNLADLPLGPVIEEAINLTGPAAAARHILVRQNCPAGIGVHADAARLRQVLLNLLSNAVKYNRDAGLVLVSCKPSGGRVRITVIDTGMGIPEQQRARLFQPFQRLGAEMTATEGTGIGLVVSRKLVEAMNGEIGFESGDDIGSRFWVDLPATQADCADAQAMNAAVVPAPGAGIRGRVLYVEDSLTNLAVMRHVFLQLSEVELLTVDTAEAGLDLIRENPPDLVLMDINLPGISGLDALRAIKADPATADLPVVAVSAAALPQDVKQGLDAGFQAYLTKPFDALELLALVRDLLGKAASHGGEGERLS